MWRLGWNADTDIPGGRQPNNAEGKNMMMSEDAIYSAWIAFFFFPSVCLFIEQQQKNNPPHATNCVIGEVPQPQSSDSML